MEVSFHCSELAQYSAGLEAAARSFPAETRSFLRREGSKLRIRTRRSAKRQLKPHRKPERFRHAAHYVDTIKRGKPYTYHDKHLYAIRTYSYAPHAHLLEYGHRLISPFTDRVGRVRAIPVFAAGRAAFMPVFYDDTDRFIEDVIAKL